MTIMMLMMMIILIIIIIIIIIIIYNVCNIDRAVNNRKCRAVH